jgi:hypothetical protein
MSSKLSAILSVSGESLDFQKCSQYIGLIATSNFERTYDYDSSLVPHRQWSFATEKVERESVDDAVVQLIQHIPSIERLSEFAANNEYDIEIICQIDVYEDRPILELSNRTIQILCQLNARFSMDIHDYTE